jgi:heterotetrameric sarcosine oxidase delta subunit
MILIPCPHCGERNSSEFTYIGEVKPRPRVLETTASEWREYLYLKRNPAGFTTEQWRHNAGCGKFFIAERHTVTNEIRRSYLPREATK